MGIVRLLGPKWSAKILWRSWRAVRQKVSCPNLKAKLTVLLLLVVFTRLALDAFKNVVWIEPISVPKILEEQGYGTQAMANYLLARIIRIHRQVRESRRSRFGVLSAENASDFQIPQSGLSYHEMRHIIQQLLGIEPQRITINVGLANPLRQNPGESELEVVLRISGWRSATFHEQFEVRGQDLGLLVTEISKHILSEVDPVVAAYHAYFIEKDGERALDLIESNTHRSSNTKAELTTLRGIMLADRGQRKEAVSVFREAISINPSSPRSYNNLGLALADDQQWQESARMFQRAIQIDPTYAGAYNNWGDMLDRKGDIDEAAKKFEFALRLDPNLVEALNNWGNVLTKQHRWQEAVAKYERALRINPNHGGIHHNLGKAFSNIGQQEKAIQEYEKAGKGINEAELLFDWAVALENQGKLEFAAAKYRGVLSQNPADVDAYRSLGRILSQIGRLDEAKEMNRKANEQESRNRSAEVTPAAPSNVHVGR